MNADDLKALRNPLILLLAVIAGMYAVYHGPAGLTTIARRVHRLTAILKAGLVELGFAVPTTHFFDTPLVFWAARTARPMNSPLSSATKKPSPASIGVVCSSSSWP